MGLGEEQSAFHAVWGKILILVVNAATAQFDIRKGHRTMWLCSHSRISRAHWERRHVVSSASRGSCAHEHGRTAGL
nr:hypothetical protein CFP56_69542 [Quercus suber]